MPEMHSQSSGNAVGSWECAHHEEGGFETVARVCFFLKVLKRGWGEQRKNTVFSWKEAGFFPCLHLILFFLAVQCSAALLLLQPFWDLSVSVLFCLRSCGFPARHQHPVAGKKPLGKAARPPWGLLAEVTPAGCASLQLAAVRSREHSVKLPKYRCCRAGNSPQELTPLLLFYPTGKPAQDVWVNPFWKLCIFPNIAEIWIITGSRKTTDLCMSTVLKPTSVLIH